MQLQNRISTPSDKKTILKHFLKGIWKGKLSAPKLRKSADKSLSQPWCSHANTICTKQPWRSHYNAICRDWIAKHIRTTRNAVAEIAAPKPDLDAKGTKRRFWQLFKRNFKRKIISAKIEKICWQITFAAWMQPPQYDLRCSAAKDNSITHAAAAPSNLDAATTMRSAEIELQNTLELRATASETAAPKPDLDAKSGKKTILTTF